MLIAADKVREAKAAEATVDIYAEFDRNDPLVAETIDLIEKRKIAKKEKNFAEADRIRQYLADKVVYEGDNLKHARGMEYYLNSNDIMEHEGFKYTFCEFRELNH
jgi:cysteinyl-tRNA synthetase